MVPKTVLHSRLSDLPRESIDGGILQRTAVRTDGALITINWLEPTDSAPPEHSHPFDQLSMVVAGSMEFTVEGKPYLVSAGEALQIPRDIPHTARTVGSERSLSYDVFAPAREDYLYLAAHQSSAFNEEPTA